MAQPSYTVKWKNSSGTITDITKDVLTIPSFTDTGSGDANASVMVISANRGKYITDGNPISDFDKIEITSDDGQGKIYILPFVVKRRIPIETKSGGTTLELHSVGYEWYSQSRTFADSANTFSTDGFTAAKLIQNSYNENAGTLDPQMKGLDTTAKNKLPKWVFNNYNFGLNEETAYNRLMEVIDRNSAVINEGGANDFFELQGIGDLNTNSFTFSIFSSGSNGTPVLITDTTSVNIGQTEGGLDTLKATVVNGWGESQSGSLPKGFSQFQGGQLLYNLFPKWDSTVSYPVNALVRYLGSLWKSTVGSNLNNSPSPGLFWSMVSAADYYGNKYRYSQWTVEQSDNIKDCGSDLAGSVESGSAMGSGFFDGNLVINDGSALRSWADIVVTGDDAVPLYWRYPLNPQAPNRFYPGFRVLQKGTPTGIFGGSDVNGNAYKDAVIEYQDDVVGWLVKYPAQTKMLCAVIGEGKTYVYKDASVSAGGWGSLVSIASQTANKDRNALDCFHPYDELINDDIMPVDPTFISNQKSAIKVTYTWQSFDIPAIGSTFTFPGTWTTFDWYKAGFWFNIRFPLPPNVVRGDASSRVGELYGDNSVIKGPSFIDTENMTYSHDGFTGFTNLSCEDLGPLSSLDFLIKIKASTQDFGVWVAAGEANYKVRVIAYDRNDNVAIQDQIVPYDNLVTAMKYPLGGFNIYEARKPLGNLADLLVPPVAVSPVNIFEWRHVKQIVICSAESYDEFGRFNPGAGRYGVQFKLPFNLIPNIDKNHKLEVWFDAIRFTKPLLANSGTSGAQNIETEFIQKEEIIAYQQLKAAVAEEYQRLKFTHQEYDIVTTLKHDISFGCFFYYYNPRIVQTQSPPDIPPGDPLGNGGANTIKLVAKHISYSYTKPENGEGGALRRIVGIKRFGSVG